MRTPDNQNNTPKLPDLDDLTPPAIEIEDLTPRIELEELQAAQDAALAATMTRETRLDLSHPFVIHAAEARVERLLRDVPGLLRDEAASVVRESLEADADDGALTLQALYNFAGGVRFGVVELGRAREVFEMRQLAPHVAEVERIYQRACADLEAIGLSFGLLEAYRRRRRELMKEA